MKPPETFEHFVDRLGRVKELGFLETHRSGNTGIGKTLEDLLSIEENNIPGPDAVGVELKSTRRQSNNLTTLFTKEPPRVERNLWNQALVKRLGYTDSQDRRALKVTLEPDRPNSQGFYLSYTDRAISVDHEEYGTCALYPIGLLRETFEQKLPELVLVIADVRRIEGQEFFWYNEAYHLEDFDPVSFLELMRDGVITLDIRMHIKPNGNIRNRGTAWRILDDSKLDEAFENRTPLLDYDDRTKTPPIQRQPHSIDMSE